MRLLLLLAALLPVSVHTQATCDIDAEGNCLDRSCTNKYPDCDKWAAEGHCTGQAKDVRFMVNFCKQACQICDFQGNLTQLIRVRGNMTLLETPHGVTQAIIPGYEALIQQSLSDMEHYMQHHVEKEPSLQSVRDICKNHNANCAYWAATGVCSSNAHYMETYCNPVCKTCHLLDMRQRCPLDPTEPMAIANPGDLNQLFERIVTDAQQYQPRVLSRPSSQTCSATDCSTIPDGPWVVVFDNFLTAEEANRLAELGSREGYLDSVQFIRDKDAQQRNSKHTWCKEGCLEDALVQQVERKIQALTGIPIQNAEYIQLLKYEPGEYYKTHTDYNPGHVPLQTGVRTLTFFLYLNTVERGGGTNFPQLNLTVTPVQGKAVLWPSVLNEDPNALDNRTLHQSLTVEQGTKYGANVWIHQRTYRGETYYRGCTYA